MSAEAGPILVFDGVCVLCNGWVRFLLRHDTRARYRFAAMQGDPDDPASLLLVDEAGAHTDTAAIRRVLHGLGGGWRLPAALLGVLPRALLDPLYRRIARNRYRWFGRHAVCALPPPGAGERFL
jgi:predicted DCC family thiol-disulfide oxidoreductase YuxK